MSHSSKYFGPSILAVTAIFLAIYTRPTSRHDSVLTAQDSEPDAAVPVYKAAVKELRARLAQCDQAVGTVVKWREARMKVEDGTADISTSQIIVATPRKLQEGEPIRLAPAPPPCVLDPSRISPDHYVVHVAENSVLDAWQSRVLWYSFCNTFMNASAPAYSSKIPNFLRILVVEGAHTLINNTFAFADPTTGEDVTTVMPTHVVPLRNPILWAAVRDFPLLVRSIALQMWLDSYPRTDPMWLAPTPGPSIAVIESDMMFRPQHTKDISEPLFTAQLGTVVGPWQGFMQVADSAATRDTVAKHCKRDCNRILGMESPWTLHRDSLYRILPHWQYITRALRVDPRRRDDAFSDFWGMSIGAVTEGVAMKTAMTVCHVQYPGNNMELCRNASALHASYDIVAWHGVPSNQSFNFVKRRHLIRPPTMNDVAWPRWESVMNNIIQIEFVAMMISVAKHYNW